MQNINTNQDEYKTADLEMEVDDDFNTASIMISINNKSSIEIETALNTETADADSVNTENVLNEVVNTPIGILMNLSDNNSSFTISESGDVSNQQNLCNIDDSCEKYEDFDRIERETRQKKKEYCDKTVTNMINLFDTNNKLMCTVEKMIDHGYTLSPNAFMKIRDIKNDLARILKKSSTNADILPPRSILSENDDFSIDRHLVGDATRNHTKRHKSNKSCTICDEANVVCPYINEKSGLRQCRFVPCSNNGQYTGQCTNYVNNKCFYKKAFGKELKTQAPNLHIYCSAHGACRKSK